MSNKSVIGIDLLSPLLFYQNPIDIFETQNGSTQVDGVPTELNSCRGCNQNLASNNPASQYQRQKIIQNTVRVAASLYTMNLAALASYQKPDNQPQVVEQAGTPYLVPSHTYWNQMSDRAKPAHQVAKVASGATYHASSTRHTITRDRPGAMSPGGIGVDIKHNSYDRYLNKLKGKSPLRRGIIPPNYGAPIPFNPAFPIYGGKIVKTGIIAGCHCPDGNNLSLERIYADKTNALQDLLLAVTYEFHVGDFVWTSRATTNVGSFYRAEIIAFDQATNTYTVKFDDGTIETKSYNDLMIYFDCTCNPELPLMEQIYAESPYMRNVIVSSALKTDLYCNVLNSVADFGEIL